MSLSPAHDRGAALLVVAVDGDALPNAVDVIGIAAGKGVDSSTVRGIDDENAADRRLPVVGHQCACGHYVDRMLLGTVEMDAMVAVMLGAGRQNVFFVERVDDVQHGSSLVLGKSTGEGRLIFAGAKRPRMHQFRRREIT